VPEEREGAVCLIGPPNFAVMISEDQAAAPELTDQFMRSLRGILPSDAVLIGEDDRLHYGHDETRT
jgi:hypothetical protein